MNNFTFLRASAILVLSLYFLGGCTGLNTLPAAARGGDTLMLAVGTPEGLTKNNISVIFTSDVDSSTVDLTSNIQALVKFYPSKNSAVALKETDIIYRTAGHEPWLSTLAINLPLSVPDGGPLVVGTGTINVSCIPRESCTYPLLFPHNNDVDTAVEIIPGLGEPNPFGYDLGLLGGSNAETATLEDREHALVTTSHTDGITFTTVGGPVMGAAEFVVNAPMTDIVGGVIPDQDIVVFAEDISLFTGSQRSFIWKKNGDNFEVSFISPTGMKFTELRFYIVTRPSGSGIPYIFAAAPTIISEKYYDLNGSIISASTPTANVAVIN